MSQLPLFLKPRAVCLDLFGPESWPRCSNKVYALIRQQSFPAQRQGLRSWLIPSEPYVEWKRELGMRSGIGFGPSV